jgi:hypothetical protein
MEEAVCVSVAVTVRVVVVAVVDTPVSVAVVAVAVDVVVSSQHWERLHLPLLGLMLQTVVAASAMSTVPAAQIVVSHIFSTVVVDVAVAEVGTTVSVVLDAVVLETVVLVNVVDVSQKPYWSPVSPEAASQLHVTEQSVPSIGQVGPVLHALGLPSIRSVLSDTSGEKTWCPTKSMLLPRRSSETSSLCIKNMSDGSAVSWLSVKSSVSNSTDARNKTGTKACSAADTKKKQRGAQGFNEGHEPHPTMLQAETR